MQNEPGESYTIMPMSLNVDTKLPSGFESVYNSSSCLNLPCRGCQVCQCRCIACRRWDAPHEERSAGLDTKKLFVELLAA